MKHVAYQHDVARGYNKNVRMRPFNVDDLVLGEVVPKFKKTKFKPNWEGPIALLRRLATDPISWPRWTEHLSATHGMQPNFGSFMLK